MKFLILALYVAAALATSPDLDQEWQMWKDNNQRKYGAEEEEDFRRFVWEYNYKIVTEHNQRYALGHTTYTMAMNQFADMTNVEFRKRMNGFASASSPLERTHSRIDVSPLPDFVDWNSKGWVTPVKNQGQCGSAWAFSATGALEGQTFNKTGQLPDISEQNLVDCATAPKYDCAGCNGGTMVGAFQYVIDNMGIDSESSYPYQAQDMKCRFSPANVVATERTYVVLPSGDEKALQRAVATVGPISAAIAASHVTFQLYQSGIYDEPQCSQTALAHNVLIIGYAIENGNPYWLVKNSWGADWGMNGFVRMSRSKDNQCGIASRACYPLV